MYLLAGNGLNGVLITGQNPKLIAVMPELAEGQSVNVISGDLDKLILIAIRCTNYRTALYALLSTGTTYIEPKVHSHMNCLFQSKTKKNEA